MAFKFTYAIPNKDALAIVGTIDKSGFGTWIRARCVVEGNTVVISGDKGIFVTEARLLKKLDSLMAGIGGKRLM